MREFSFNREKFKVSCFESLVFRGMCEKEEREGEDIGDGNNSNSKVGWVGGKSGKMYLILHRTFLTTEACL